jgi:hypothetical protein
MLLMSRDTQKKEHILIMRYVQIHLKLNINKYADITAYPHHLR